jgi:hypothetical protein
MKKSAKVLHYFGLDFILFRFLQIFYSRAVLEKKVQYFPTFFGDWFTEKEGGLHTYNPSAEEV